VKAAVLPDAQHGDAAADCPRFIAHEAAVCPEFRTVIMVE